MILVDRQGLLSIKYAVESCFVWKLEGGQLVDLDLDEKVLLRYNMKMK